jgi:hypothetical protein
MTKCPHCNQEIEFVGTRRSIWKRNLTPGLGTGALIAIAIIVMVFSRGTSAEIERLNNNVKAVEAKVDSLKAANRLDK